MAENLRPTTLYVGNLNAEVNEEKLCCFLSQVAPVRSCLIKRESGYEHPYAFLEFKDHKSAVKVLLEMNGRVLYGRKLRINWALSSPNIPKVDTSHHHHVFVGGLPQEIDRQILQDTFEKFGSISKCRIIRYPDSMRSKGYGFVTYVRRADAEKAIQSMNGKSFGPNKLTVNWSVYSPQPPRFARPQSPPANLDTIQHNSINEVSHPNISSYENPYPYMTFPYIQPYLGNYTSANSIPAYTMWYPYFPGSYNYGVVQPFLTPVEDSQTHALSYDSPL